MSNDENYFELFGVPESPEIDIKDLRKAWHNLQLEHHPDSACSDDKRGEYSSHINEAYRVISDPFLRVHYILSINDALPSAADELQVPVDFLEKHIEQQEKIFHGDVAQQQEVSREIDQEELDLRRSLFEDIKSKNWQNARHNFMKWSFLFKTQKRLSELLDQ
ncbi:MULTISPECIES: Fe-S protein assembly co-chaperone HscB [Candidatus Ichthyocystis]|uniref:Putative co-chaperone protein hscB,DnaJ domain n=1 Tax=Candidatus Ichthyocystis hellenicum TaxID=1561003 RepID=A0A0S4M1X0_9BURK|nr:MULTISPECIES: Fe-S protein assembly co-chaperone HscB [Ichthyocystis]CUT17617.1 putative co-chaperone protein hscB,DnaJ domain [Candidatus Ichthyocystis hellenicum]